MIINNPPYEKMIEHNGKEVTVHLWKDVFLAGAKVNS